MTAVLLDDVPHAGYHADAWHGGGPTLSRSCAHTLLSLSPLHAHHEHPRFGNACRKASKPMDAGSLVHALLLNSGPPLAVIHFDSYRTNNAKALRDTALAEGRLPVLEEDMDAAKEAVGRILLNLPFDLGACQEEVTVLWEDDAYLPSPQALLDGKEPVLRPGVPCRARMDLWSREEAVIRDLKVVTKGHVRPDSFVRWVPYEGLDLQAAVYPRAMELVYPEMAGRIRFEFVLVELDPPHDVVVIPVGGGWRELGGRKWERAVRLWAECLASGAWPGRSGKPYLADSPPTWVVEQETAIDLNLGERPDDGLSRSERFEALFGGEE